MLRIAVAGQSNASGLAPGLQAALGELGIEAATEDFALGGSSIARHAEATHRWVEGAGKHLFNLRAFKPHWTWWIQGENEALDDTTEGQYSRELAQLVALLPGRILLSPIAGLLPEYKSTRAVLAAQYRAIDGQKVFLGPEYHDLPHAHEHLTGEGKDMFVRRAAHWFDKANDPTWQPYGHLHNRR